jgi:YesN/AraC family two-component response regulator
LLIILYIVSKKNDDAATFAPKKIVIRRETKVTEFVRDIKMQNAEQLILSKTYSNSEITFQTGFSIMAYFQELFKDKYGVLPSNIYKNWVSQD